MVTFIFDGISLGGLIAKAYLHARQQQVPVLVITEARPVTLLLISRS
jgi:hypothetical protein